MDFRALWPARETVRRLACVTMVRDEDYFIEMYIKHYLMNCPDADFYIIDHASTRPVSSVIREKFHDLAEGRVNVIRIPDIPFDDDFKSMALSSVGSMACAAYDIVIVSDVDELVVPLKGDLVGTCLALSADVIAPLGFEVIQNSVFEDQYDVDAPVFSQRKYGYFKSSQTKPVIWKAASIVAAGIHKCMYDYVFSSDLITVHMRFADREQARYRVSHRRQVTFSKNQISRKYGVYWSVAEDVRLRFFEHITKADFSPVSDIIPEFMEQLSKTKHRNAHGYFSPDLHLKTKYCYFD